MDRFRKRLPLAFCIAAFMQIGDPAVQGEIAICHGLRNDGATGLSKECSHLPHYLANVELVVVGKIHRADEATEGPGLFDVDVEQVWLGRTSEKRLRFKADFNGIGEREIVGLRAKGPGAEAPYQARYAWTPKNLDEQRSLIQAAFDEVVLSTDVIYAGRLRSSRARRSSKRSAKDIQTTRAVFTDRGELMSTVSSRGRRFHRGPTWWRTPKTNMADR